MSPRDPKQFEEIREKSKEKILYAAFELFSSLGYWSTSISKIAQKAGISKGLMYNYFNSKEDLLHAVVDKIVEIIRDILDLPEGNHKPEEKMLILLEKIFNHIEKNTSLIRMMTKIGLQIGQFDFANKIMTQQYKEILKKLETLLFELNFDYPDKEAILLAATLDGIIIQSLMFGDNFPLEDAKKELIRKYTSPNNKT